MEQFEINLVGDNLTVLLNTDESFTISKNGERLGIIWPEQTDGGVIWKSDNMSIDQAMQIGELIDEHNM